MFSQTLFQRTKSSGFSSGCISRGLMCCQIHIQDPVSECSSAGPSFGVPNLVPVAPNVVKVQLQMLVLM